MSSSSSFLDAVNPSTSSSATSRRSTSTVRPRNRRLISVTDDDDEQGIPGGDLAHQQLPPASDFDLTPPQSPAATPSPYTSRGVSPLPTTHPSRATTPANRSKQSLVDYFSAFGLDNGSKTQSANSKLGSNLLETSWSSLQSLASSVLGSDTARPASNKAPNPNQRRKPSRSDAYISSAPKPTPSSWGPSKPSTVQIGSGTKEERRALVQAKKREALLLANEDSVSELKGRHKRRDSCGPPDPSAADPEHDEDALVYVHQVQPTDSITGVTIKYGCNPAVMRKANGFWPSDSIQSRKTVLLPVEACTVKGRRIQSKENANLLEDETPGRRSSEDLNGSSIAPAETTSRDNSVGADAQTEKKMNDSKEKTWKHEAWVDIDGFPGPVEIGRVPRRTLGFFPRTRRKSQSVPYTDSETPATSVDIPRNEPMSEPRTSSSHSQAISTAPSSTFSPTRNGRASGSFSRANGPAPPSGSGHRRQRSSFHLSGPGGVGTLGRDVIAPGPAPDKLNKFFSQHLPNLAAPANPTLPRSASFESTSTVASGSSNTGIENVGGAIEGWMRKMATRAKAGLNELQQNAQSGQVYGLGQAMGIGGMGDLIEMDDSLEGRTTPGSSTGRPAIPLGARSRSNLRDESSQRKALSHRALSRDSSSKED